MLRLTVISETPEEVVLKVEGRVSDESVALLEHEGARWLRKVRCLVLDLTGVQFIGRMGIALLKRWSCERLVLRGGSPFVRSLLTTHGLD